MRDLIGTLGVIQGLLSENGGDIRYIEGLYRGFFTPAPTHEQASRPSQLQKILHHETWEVVGFRGLVVVLQGYEGFKFTLHPETSARNAKLKL